jgi:hypothetical protein
MLMCAATLATLAAVAAATLATQVSRLLLRLLFRCVAQDCVVSNANRHLQGHCRTVGVPAVPRWYAHHLISSECAASSEMTSHCAWVVSSLARFVWRYDGHHERFVHALVSAVRDALS